VVLLSAPLALIPGEVVRARVRLKARHGEGEVLEWLAPDARRADPLCPVAQRCGGCGLWGAGALAGELKRQMAGDLLQRQQIAGLLGGEPGPAPDGALQWDWLLAPPEARRTRIQLHWDGAHLGYFGRASNRVVPIQACPMAAESVSAAIPQLAAALARGRLPNAPGRWELATGTPPGSVSACRASPGAPVYAMLEDGAVRRVEQAPVLEHQLAGRVLRHRARSFFQACPEWAAQAFTATFAAWDLRGGTLYDLFGGAGFCSALLAGRFQRHVVVDFDAAAVADARRNLAGLPHKVEPAEVEEWLHWHLNRPGEFCAEDVLLLDPPRAGLSPALCATLCRLRTAALVLIGCDGAAFCRDVKRLAPAWQLKRLTVADLFPNTPGAEFLGCFARAY
jgi:23S rRNA (uracil1939-C5)-methyltransferase